MIVPGQKSEVAWGDGNWIFLDIGFSCESRSCGFAFGEETPKSITFANAISAVIDRVQTSERSTRLVVEAPLSVCFDRLGNPKGRRIERQDSGTRYWYVGAGCVVMTAALYLIRAIYGAGVRRDVLLYEGFHSFKKRANRSNHSQDVNDLRRIVQAPQTVQHRVFDENDLRSDHDDQIQSAFHVADIDCGIPAVLALGSFR